MTVIIYVCMYIYIYIYTHTHTYDRKVTPAYLLATREFRSCFSISADVEGAGGEAVMGQRTVAGRGKGPENHLQWKPWLATWLCAHAHLYGLAMSLTSGKPFSFREYLELSVQIMSAG